MSNRLLIIALSAVSVSLFAAGCGGGGKSPGVANLASAPPAGAATTTGGSAPAVKTPNLGGPSGHFQIGMMVGTTDGPKFSACMRKHGITSFPDPNGQGLITIHSGMGIDPQSPAFQNARTACDKLLPNGGQPTPAQAAAMQRQMLQFSVCMRAHGIKDFPDPDKNGLRISVHPGSDLDPHNPTFQNAQQACQKYLPLKGAGLKGG
jgi:hypothetical protein